MQSAKEVSGLIKTGEMYKSKQKYFLINLCNQTIIEARERTPELNLNRLVEEELIKAEEGAECILWDITESKYR